MNPSQSEELQSPIRTDLNIRDVLAPMFRRKRLMCLVFCATLLAAVFIAIGASSLHEARMEILVNRQTLDPMVISEPTHQTPSSPQPLTEEEVNSEIELLKSTDILRQVVLANGLQEFEKGSLSAWLLSRGQDDWYVAKAADRLSKKLNIDVVTKTNAIEVAYKAKDPKVAYGVLKELADLYMQKHLAVQRPTGSYDFFAKETERYREALAGSEQRLATFGREHGVVVPDIERTEMAQQVVNSVANLHQAEQAIAADEQRIQADEVQMKATPARSSTAESSDDANLLLQQLLANLLTAQIKRTQLALKYDASYPLVQEADQEIAQTQAAIADARKTQYVNQTTDRDPTYELLREDVAKTQADLASQKATATALGRSIQSMQSQMVQLDGKALDQADLIRETKADESNYLLYLSKREQERTSDALDQKRIGNVAIAVPPTIPVLPVYSPIIVLLAGFVGAAFVSVAAAFVAEYLDPCFRTPGELGDFLGIPVLASFPRQAIRSASRYALPPV
jgi:uncharacterized protein involved in exopolysaccharide biosynthesis